MRNNYTYSVNGNTVYCITHYAGRPVRGTSKCDPSDEFNLEDGKKLSKARCNVKVAKKKLKMKQEKAKRALSELQIAIKNAEHAQKYQQEAMLFLQDAENTLAEIEAKLS